MGSKKISASVDYMSKEKVREELQKMICTFINNNSISSKEQLDEFFKTLDTASKALKMVPYEVYKAISKI